MAGDQLDAKITKAEAEVAALEGTLGQLQASNSAFGASLRAGEDAAAQARAAALRCARRKVEGWGWRDCNLAGARGNPTQPMP